MTLPAGYASTARPVFNDYNSANTHCIASIKANPMKEQVPETDKIAKFIFSLYPRTTRLQSKVKLNQQPIEAIVNVAAPASTYNRL